MNLLIDFVTARKKTGAGECLRRVFFEILERIREKSQVRIYALWDSRVGIAYEDLQPELLKAKYGIECLDCAEKKITAIVEERGIDRFYIACGQYAGDYSCVTDLKCEVVCVIHDCYAEDLLKNHLFDYWALNRGAYEFRARFKIGLLNKLRYLRLKWLFAEQIIKGNPIADEKHLIRLRTTIELLRKNPRSRLVVSSEYTRSAIQFHFDTSQNERMPIEILWPPNRMAARECEIVDTTLSALVRQKEKYILMVSANRESKNPLKLQRAFAQFRKYDPTMKLLMVGYKGEVGENVIAVPFLSDGDLDAAFRNCHALIYPSYFEGFGYPPVEAMRYGKPILASNVTSIPEVLGDSPIYFSPFYETEIFAALMKLSRADYSILSKRSSERYSEITRRQERNLNRLLDIITNPWGSVSDE